MEVWNGLTKRMLINDKMLVSPQITAPLTFTKRRFNIMGYHRLDPYPIPKIKRHFISMNLG